MFIVTNEGRSLAYRSYTHGPSSNIYLTDAAWDIVRSEAGGSSSGGGGWGGGPEVKRGGGGAYGVCGRGQSEKQSPSA